MPTELGVGSSLHKADHGMLHAACYPYLCNELIDSLLLDSRHVWSIIDI